MNSWIVFPLPNKGREEGAAQSKEVCVYTVQGLGFFNTLHAYYYYFKVKILSKIVNPKM